MSRGGDSEEYDSEEEEEDDSGSDYDEESDEEEEESGSDEEESGSEEDESGSDEEDEETGGGDNNSNHHASWGNSSYSSEYSDVKRGGISSTMSASGMSTTSEIIASNEGEFGKDGNKLSGNSFNLFGNKPSRKASMGGKGRAATIDEGEEDDDDDEDESGDDDEDDEEEYNEEPEPEQARMGGWGVDDGSYNDDDDRKSKPRKSFQGPSCDCSCLENVNWVIMGVVAACLVVVGVIVIIIVLVAGGGGGGGGGGDKDESPTVSPAPSVSFEPTTPPSISPAPTVSPAPTISPAPTNSPTVSAAPTITPRPTFSPAPMVPTRTGYPPFVPESGQALYDLIVENSADNGAAVDIPNTPQHRAYLWSQNIDVRTQSVNDARKLQRFRLMAFYYATNGPTDWTEQGFWASPQQDECNWEFGQAGGELSCNGAGELTILELVNVGMTGTLVPELSEMTSLRELVLDNTGKPDTGLVGGIPDSLGNLENLNVVKIVGNFFDTPLSDSLFTKWTRVVTLNLSRNQLPGSIPSSVSSLTQVRQFHLGENQLTGPLPSQVQFMTRATLFIVANNQLRSSVPSLLALTELRTLRLDNNNFSGSFPAISTLTKLQANLDLSNNGFSGGIPNSIGNHVNLRSLNLKNTGLTGPLPTGFGNLSKLRTLDLSGNPGLTGTVSVDVCNNLDFAKATGSGSAIVDCGVEDTCSAAQNVCCSCCECAT